MGITVGDWRAPRVVKSSGGSSAGSSSEDEVSSSVVVTAPEEVLSSSLGAEVWAIWKAAIPVRTASRDHSTQSRRVVSEDERGGAEVLVGERRTYNTGGGTDCR